ncbi:nitroreductase family protein [Acidaminococcus timonensis]|uniref:nitroreductase family protein n=1 Tax=Acidaminococcus timonensis TaxID=1871002 RepID=UPI001F162293|nr:nitroreductase family protein [Acidaminococcus timonensis]
MFYLADILTVDQEKCVKCGICSKVCPSCIIEMQENGPVCINDRSCMSCGHCVSVCPTGALDNIRCPRAEMDPIPMPVLDSQTAYNFLRMRRSIRNFTDELVSEDKMRQLLDICRYAPTAANSQGLYYIVVSDRELIKKITDCVADWMQEEIDNNSPRARYFRKVLETYRSGTDIIGRNARQLVFALARRLNQTGISNCEQAWAYAELYAPTLGLGTTIMGFIQTCAQCDYEPLRELLEVPKKQVIVGTLLVGYPKYKYHALVDRQHLKVEFR